MFDLKKERMPEKVMIAGLLTRGVDPVLFEEDMHELGQLCATAGARVLKSFVQRRDAPMAPTYLGGGKLEEIREAMKQESCNTLVVDSELSAGQVRNMEKIVQGKVIDRSQLILDIFAAHAQTTEARIQVELAQMKTLYPRLTHAWSHFSQQVGGIGTRGPGEKQLEVDRRLVQKRILDLTKKLKVIEKSRATQRKSRKTEFSAILAGYTNVGKSVLLNALAHTQVLVQNKLFATLDIASKRVHIQGHGTIVVSDTVGFLRKLPHHLVASFRSTLEVAKEANLLLVVLDASSAWIDRQFETVRTVLDDLGAHGVRRLVVLNKADRATDPFVRKKLEIAYPDAVWTSALTGDGVEELKTQIGRCIDGQARDAAEALELAQKNRELNGEPFEYP